MRNSIVISLTLILITSQCISLRDALAGEIHSAPKSSQTTQPEIRHLHFPASYSVGMLQLKGNESRDTQNSGTGIGKAQGDVTVTVPPGHTISLELNPRCIEHPELIKSLNTVGINRLKLAYLSMDEVDHSFCDKALQALPEFKDIISVDVERSDVTDKGLAGFKSLGSVKYVTAFGCAFDGSIFKEAQKLKNLRKIDLMFNPLKGVNFRTLSALPNLKDLNLNQCDIGDDDMKYLPKCPALKKLLLLDNKKITDKSLPVIKQQTTLEELDLRGTGVSLDGILSLKALKLKALILTVRRYRESELTQLKDAFPKALVNWRGGQVNKDDQMLYAPLK